MKKILTLILAIVATTTLWAQRFQSGDLYYNITSDTTVEVTYEYYWSVNNYAGLSIATIPETVTNEGITYNVASIGANAFYCCTSLIFVTIPNSVTSIGDIAFYYCTSLTSVTIPNSVTSIGYEAFYRCSSLTSITIPNSVTSIGNSAFSGCSSLTSITVEKGNSIYDSRENCNAVIETATNTLIAGCQNTIIPNGVTSIGDYAFNCCSSLTSITIPNSVTSIGSSAFRACSALTSITIPNSVTSIGGSAFFGCSSLTSITIPNSVTSIGDRTFYDCSSLTSITIPNSVTSIGDDAFANTGILKDTSNWENNVIYIDDCLIDAKTSILGAYTIKESTRLIAVRAFYGCSSLTSITIPNSVTSIGNSAFFDCSSLDTIYIEAMTPPTLGSNIFSDSIAICYIPCRTKAAYMESEWANYVNVFTEYDFGQTSGVCGEQLYWNYANTKLTITGDGAMFDDLAECIPWNWLQDSIRTIEMNEGITHIADDAFNGCFALRELYLPASVQSIGDNAFAGTPRLYEVTCLAPEPPIAEKSSFTNYDAYFHAYCDAQRYYSVDPVWKKFHNVECIVNENTVTNNVTITPSDCEATVVWLSNDAAAAYSLVITKNGVTFCTLRFNKYGQLTNIAFAPSRTHNNKQQAAEATSTGYSFTITGLDAGTRYDYQFSVLNDSNESIDEYFGEFTTHSTTAVEQISSAEANCQKLLRDNQLLILRDGKTYNTMGAEIR